MHSLKPLKNYRQLCRIFCKQHLLLVLPMRALFSLWCSLVIIFLAILSVPRSFSFGPYSGPLPSNRSSAVSSEVNVTVTPGVMNLTPDQVVSTMSKETDDKTTAQWSIGMMIQDMRGSGVGWIMSASLEHLTTVSPPKAAAHNTSPLLLLSPSFRYTGWWGESKEGPCTVRITIMSPGQIGDAKFAAQIRGGGELYCLRSHERHHLYDPKRRNDHRQ